MLVLLAALGLWCLQAEGYGSPAAARDPPALSPLPLAQDPAAIQAAETETPAAAVPTPLPVQENQSALRFSFNFTSGRADYVVTTTLDPGDLPSMGGGGDCPLASWQPGDEGAVSSYYASIIRDPGEDGLFSGLLTGLRRIRTTENLNDDQYLELMVHFVQQIPYDPRAPLCPRTPAGVIVAGKGDCDEKSLLLLGLMEREGYDGALLLFPDKHHATAGIRIDVATTPSFRVFVSGGKKYVYIETTRPSFIGLYPDDFANETPIIVPAGNGTTTYQAINDVMHIVSTQKRMEEKMNWLAGTCSGMLPEIQSLQAKLSEGNSYTTQDEYDTDYTRYSTLVTEYNNDVSDLRQISEVYQYILDHQSDREGVDGRIANSKVENLL